jgi:hypothetical protein
MRCEREGRGVCGCEEEGVGEVHVAYMRPRKEGRERKRARGCEFSLAIIFILFLYPDANAVVGRERRIWRTWTDLNSSCRYSWNLMWTTTRCGSRLFGFSPPLLPYLFNRGAQTQS